MTNVGNYYADHALVDSDGDGITDNDFDLPGVELDAEFPLAAPPDLYHFD